MPLCGALGCDSQVGEAYTGEPLLSVRGTVVLTEPRGGDLVPALAFGNERDYTRRRHDLHMA